MPPRSSPSSPPHAPPPRRPRSSRDRSIGRSTAVLVAIGCVPTFRSMVGVLRWESATVGIGLVIACACNARSLVPGADAGADAASVTTPTTGAGQAAAGGYAGRTSVGEGGAGGAGSRSARRWTRSAPRGASGRCPCRRRPCYLCRARGCRRCSCSRRQAPTCQASTPAAPASTSALRRHSRSARTGSIAALVTSDGLTRMISIASQQVLAVLASPRAMIYAVAYEPHGRGVLTLAHEQREVTFWRASDWTPVWRVTLPGTAYYHAYIGGVAFSPDGATAVVSPGIGDIPSRRRVAERSAPGARTAGMRCWTSRTAGVAGASSWRSRRLAAHCNHWSRTAARSRSSTRARWPRSPPWPTWGTTTVRAAFVASRRSAPRRWTISSSCPRASANPPSPHAFRLSDGAALPAPAVTALPTAFMPDGASVLNVADGVLQRIRLADGAMLSSTTLGSVGPIGMSADGGVLAVGSAGGQLLRVLTAGADTPTTVCTTDDPAGYAPPSALSFDGQVLALARDGEVRIIRRADGAVVGRRRGRHSARVDAADDVAARAVRGHDSLESSRRHTHLSGLRRRAGRARSRWTTRTGRSSRFRIGKIASTAPAGT